MTTYKSVKYNISGADLTGIPTSAITTGTMADARISASSVSQHATTYDDNKLQSNVALLGFKTAVNGSLAKYNLQDQIIDEYTDATGVDASASTNETLTAGVYSGASGSDPTGGASIDTSVSGYKTHVFTASAALTVGSAGNVDILVVAGGGSGGSDYGGGGGAGGLIYKGTHALTANTYDAVIGAGGAASTAAGGGNTGGDSTWTINGGAVEFTAKGGGLGGSEGGSVSAGSGGSGGGSSYPGGTGGTTNQSSQSGESGSLGFGYAGGNGTVGPNYNPGGGGGAGSVGTAGNSISGAGGTGKDYSAIFGTAVGDSGWFASGGGGGWTANGSSGVGTASNGGGGAGGGSDGAIGILGQANTGGGGGGRAGNSTSANSIGGSGVILVRYATGAFVSTGGNLTLQSNDTTASTANPDYADMVMLIENASGTATLNTDIKGYISEDSGVTFTEGVLVDEGTWGTNKKILAFHDLDISAQTGSAMCYKITTHNQSAGVKETKIHATSIGWR